ncbi:MAG TPA: hypothetical protein VIY86_04840, partial [Pirellulaceae bacterium]
MVAAGLAVFIACLPALSGWGPVRNWMLGQVTGKVRGQLTADALHIGWRTPLSIEGLRLVAPDGTEVITIPRCSGDRSLGQILFSPTSLGNYRFESPRLHVRLRPGGSNLADAFARRAPSVAAPLTSRVAETVRRRVSVSAELSDGVLEFQGEPGGVPWTLGDLNLRIGLHRPTWQNPRSYVVLDSGRLLDHIQVTPEITRDLLRFIAPILSQATTSEGSFSLSTAGAVFPLDAPRDGFCRGELDIHEIRGGPGPLVRELATVLRIPPEVQLVEESRITFQLRDRKVRHKGLRFKLGRTRIATSGEVGLDESIQLLVEIRLPDQPREGDPVLPERIARFLRGRTVKIPFRGTLRQPRIDW